MKTTYEHIIEYLVNQNAVIVQKIFH